MKNLSPIRTQHLIICLKRANYLLHIDQEEFLRRLKKDPCISFEIGVIQWEINILYGAEPDEANFNGRNRVMLYLQSLVWLWLEHHNKDVMNEDIFHVFNTVNEMYYQYYHAGKLK